MDFFMMHVRKKYVTSLLLSWLLLSVFSFGNVNTVTNNETWLDSAKHYEILGWQNYLQGNFDLPAGADLRSVTKYPWFFKPHLSSHTPTL